MQAFFVPSTAVENAVGLPYPAGRWRQLARNVRLRAFGWPPSKSKLLERRQVFGFSNQSPLNRSSIMLYWTVVFLVIALIAGALGFGVIGGMAYSAAKILFFVFLVLFVLSLLSGTMRRPVA